MEGTSVRDDNEGINELMEGCKGVGSGGHKAGDGGAEQVVGCVGEVQGLGQEEGKGECPVVEGVGEVAGGLRGSTWGRLRSGRMPKLDEVCAGCTEGGGDEVAAPRVLGPR